MRRRWPGPGRGDPQRPARLTAISHDNEESLRRAVAAFNDPSHHEGYLELYSPEVVLHGYPRGLEGLEGARTFYAALWSAFPDARLEVEDVIASNDRLAARYRLTGVQARDFYGAPVTGTQTSFDGIAWLRFRDGRVIEVWQASATLDTLTRLSVRAGESRTRHSASADAAALRWEEQHPEG